MTKKVQCKFIILIFNVKNETIQKETVSISLWGYHFRIHNFTKAQIIELRLAAGIIKEVRDGVKILGNGELTKKLDVKVNAFSATAKEKIEALGGTAEVI